MKTTLASTLLLIAATSTVASADVDQPQPAAATAISSPANIISVGLARQIEDQHDRKALSLEGLHRIGQSRSHIHVMLAFSERDSEQGGLVSGRYDQIRFGVEGRTRGRMVRGFIGADFGLAYEHTTVTSVRPGVDAMTRLDSSVLTVPRVGLEVGERFLARAIVEVPITEHDAGRDAGLGMSLAVGTAF